LGMNLRIPEDASNIESMALNRGYKLSGWNETTSGINISSLFEVNLPKGFKIKSGKQLTDKKQGIAHTKAFEYHETERAKIAPLCYTMLKQAPDYQSDLDIAVVNEQGEIVSLKLYLFVLYGMILLII